MALDYAREGIRVVALCPGTIDSELVRDLARAEGGDIDANVERYGSFHPPGTIGRPEDRAEPGLFPAVPRACLTQRAVRNVAGRLMPHRAWAAHHGAQGQPPVTARTARAGRRPWGGGEGGAVGGRAN